MAFFQNNISGDPDSRLLEQTNAWRLKRKHIKVFSILAHTEEVTLESYYWEEWLLNHNFITI